MTLVAGAKLGRYEIRSKIGAGGMGEVYLAHDTELERDVALKILAGDVTADQQRMQRFIQEAKAASALNHPNIITIYEVGQAEGQRFIATEYIKGETLRQRLWREPLSLLECFAVAVQVAAALSAAHEAKVVHRDIKPDNIMLRPDGLVKVLDFGLAKLTEKVTSAPSSDPDAATRLQINTAPGLVMGTVNYMSPEQARGKEVDARTDIWSFGVLLYEMVTGHMPFLGEITSDVIAAILKSEPAPLTFYGPDMPLELQRITRKALRKERDERYQTVKDLLLDLKSLQRELESAAEMERSVALPQSTGQLPATTANSAAGTSMPSPPAHSTSSAEYIATEIKRHQRKFLLALIVLVAAFIPLAYLAYKYLPRFQSARPSPQRALSRLTYDPGLQSEPTWSPDGRFIAYSSDRSGNFDIWIKPVGEGDPIQVTKSPAHDWQPDWSHDGQHIVFRSERDQGGLYIVPAFGGNERKISSFGYRPRWSPDGSRILFFSAATRNSVVPPKVYVVELDGSPPREVLSDKLTEFTGRVEIDWHPDGQRLSIWGDHKQQGLVFWTVPVTGGAPVKSEIISEVDKQRHELGVDLFDFRWSPSGRTLYFEGVSQGVRNLWKVEVEPQTLRWIAGPERLTTGAGLDTDVALSSDGKRLAFVTRTEHTRIWSQPFNAVIGQLTGTAQPITSAEANAVACDLTRDGKKLVFTAERAGKYELRVKSFEDGSETVLLVSDKFPLFSPVWSRDGSRIVYGRDRPPSPERAGFSQAAAHSIAMISAKGGEEQSLTSLHLLQGWPWDWTADQESIVASSRRQSNDRWGLYLFPVAAAPNAENQARLLTERPGYHAFGGRFSPDERWIALVGASATDEADRQVYVVPATGGEWTNISGEGFRSGEAHWSPDGRVIYFSSNRSGFTNLWGRRFDPQTGKPIGDVFRVTSLESPGQMISHGIAGSRFSVATDRLVTQITEASGSVWILDSVDR
jgi:serine/threonine protein kinase